MLARKLELLQIQAGDRSAEEKLQLRRMREKIKKMKKSQPPPTAAAAATLGAGAGADVASSSVAVATLASAWAASSSSGAVAAPDASPDHSSEELSDYEESDDNAPVERPSIRVEYNAHDDMDVDEAADEEMAADEAMLADDDADGGIRQVIGGRLHSQFFE